MNAQFVFKFLIAIMIIADIGINIAKLEVLREDMEQLKGKMLQMEKALLSLKIRVGDMDHQKEVMQRELNRLTKIEKERAENDYKGHTCSDSLIRHVISRLGNSYPEPDYLSLRPDG